MPNGRKLEPAAWHRFDSQGQFLSDAASVDDARERFFSAVVKLEPAVLADLKAEAASITEVKFDESDRFVSRWAQRYYLNESWCRDWAITQIRLCHAWAHGQRLVITSVALMSEPFVPQPLTGWDITSETQAEFRNRVQEYMHDTLERASKLGYKQVPDRRSLHHYVWLAGFQVCRWSRNAIAKANDQPNVPNVKGANHAAVSRAIKGLADFIGLKLRPDRGTDTKQTAEMIRSILKQTAY